MKNRILGAATFGLLCSLPLQTSASSLTSEILDALAKPVQQIETTRQRLFIQFTDTAGPQEIQILLEQLDLKSLFHSSLIPGLQIVEAPEKTTLTQLITKLSQSPFVRSIEVDRKIQLNQFSPTEPAFAQQYYLNNSGQTINGDAGTPGEDIGFIRAQNKTSYPPEGSAVTVAVLDTGVDYNHEDLAASIWTNLDEIPGDGVDNDNNGYIDDAFGYDFVDQDTTPDDLNGHGTHVAGIIGARVNGKGIHGIADGKIRIMPLRILDQNGSGKLSDAAMALEYAVNQGATVSNNSYSAASSSQALSDMIRAANNQNHLFVAAAGNNSTDMDASGGLLGLSVGKSYPAADSAENILAVAALDNKGAMADYSNYGSQSVDIAAYGSNILSTYPDNQYAYLSGTSMAAPVVSGIAAYLSFEYPQMSNLDIKNAILQGGVASQDARGKTVSGNRADLAQSLDYINGDYIPEESDNQPAPSGGLFGGGLFGGGSLLGL